MNKPEASPRLTVLLGVLIALPALGALFDGTARPMASVAALAGAAAFRLHRALLHGRA